MTPCSEALGISAFAASLDTPRIRSFGLVARVLARVQRCRAAVIRRIYVLRDRALLRIVDVTTGTGCESCRRADDKRHPVPLGHHVLLQGDCVARSHSFRCEAGAHPLRFYTRRGDCDCVRPAFPTTVKGYATQL